MAALADTLADLNREQVEASAEVQRTWALYVDAIARLEALTAREAAVRERRLVPHDLSALSQRDAIVAVMRDIGGAVRPTEVVEQLRSRGFANVEPNAVGVQIGRLRDEGVVERIGRGQYVAR